MKQYLNKIIQGDCLEVMKGIPDGCVDIIFTSPPYNLGNTHHTGNKKHQAYSDNLPEYKYQEQQRKFLFECCRVLKDTGSIIYNHKNRIKEGRQISPYEWINLVSPLIVKQEWTWFNGSQNFDKIRLYPMTERIYWLAKTPKTKMFNAINHHDLFGRDEWKAVGIKGNHTRAFPEKMVEDILSCFNESKTVLDPYAGSGTVGVVAKKMNKNYILIEKETEYCKIAQQRIDTIQPNLLTPLIENKLLTNVKPLRH